MTTLRKLPISSPKMAAATVGQREAGAAKRRDSGGIALQQVFDGPVPWINVL
jgi:hypothetical protein